MVRKLFSQHNIVLNIFVDQYNFSVDEDKQMMEKAFADIDHSDFLIVELSKKAIGVVQKSAMQRPKTSLLFT